MTKREALELPYGTLLRVTWHGGNGPHVYELRDAGALWSYGALGGNVYVGGIEDADIIELADQRMPRQR